MKILLAVDQLQSNSKSMKLAKQYMAQFSDAQLTVLYVSNESASVYYRTNIGTQHVLTDEALEYRNKLELSVLAEFRPWGARVQFRHEIGHPSKVICQVARETDVELVILGSPHRKNEVLRVGSVVQGVLSHLDRPVLVAN